MHAFNNRWRTELRTIPMQKRAAFTLVEMLVSMALILFIMVILSSAFSTGLQVFRQLKGLGDMEERLRSTSQILRRDLAAYHFENYRKLSDPNFWTVGPPQQGFFRILQSAQIPSEGFDGDNYSTRATSHILHFTSKLSGQGQGDFATSNLNPLLLGSAATQIIASQDGHYNQASSTQYRGRWYEVAYFLRPTVGNLTTGSSGVPLYTLYRRQRGIIDNANLIQNVTQTASLFPEIACQQNGTSLSFWRPDDLNLPTRRFGVNTTNGMPTDTYQDPITLKTIYTYPYLGEADPTNANLQGADLLLSDVISFEVKALVPGVTTDFSDMMSVANVLASNASPLYLKNTLFSPQVPWPSIPGMLRFSTMEQRGYGNERTNDSYYFRPSDHFATLGRQNTTSPADYDHSGYVGRGGR